MRRYVAGFALILGMSLAYASPVMAQDANCSDAQDTITITDCLQKEYNAADAVLNAAYQAAMADMKAIDAGLPQSQRGAVEALKGAQRAWIGVRDGTCAAEGFQWYGGSGQGLAILSCMLMETQARTEVLATLAQYD